MRSNKLIYLMEVAASRWKQPATTVLLTYEDALSLIEGRFAGSISELVQSRSTRKVWWVNKDIKLSEILQLSSYLGLTEVGRSKTSYIADSTNISIFADIRNNLVNYISLGRGRYQHFSTQ